MLPGSRTVGQSTGVSEKRFWPVSCYPLAESASSLRDPEDEKGGGRDVSGSVGSHAQRGV
jgi:hypothetical protein